MSRYRKPLFDRVDEQELRLQEVQCKPRPRPAAPITVRWSAIPGLPIYMTEADLLETEAEEPKQLKH